MTSSPCAVEAASERGCQFLDAEGTFRLEAPQETSGLYFPLANEAGAMASITPLLGGDFKVGQNAFFSTPVSIDDLHTSRSTRNFWAYVRRGAAAEPWSVTGVSALQTARRGSPVDESVTLEAGMLWQRVTRSSAALGLRAEVESFVPVGADRVELLRVTLFNEAAGPVTITATTALPIYGRSAANVRDHRHVTSLLQRTRCTEIGVEVCPTMCFDERGHTANTLRYVVIATGPGGQAPVGFFPTLEDFVGEGGTLDWPGAVVHNAPPTHQAGMQVDGFESVGALRFAEIVLAPGASATFLCAQAVLTDGSGDLRHLVTEAGYAAAFEETRVSWRQKIGELRFSTGNSTFDTWLRWVTLQPILRRIYGCSFLPHHDYGRGGRGWRDLWQDCLALLLLEPTRVRSMLLNNFGGVRADGTNATIIGAAPGEFLADRNDIARVWMDHGAWPLLSVDLYLNLTGDLPFLLEKKGYFRDRHTRRATARDDCFRPEDGNVLRSISGEPYHGTVLEHLLVQNLVPFFNVGDHGHIRLEGADWNDALDMAEAHGESVAFTHLYAQNLRTLAGLLVALEDRMHQHEVQIAEEFLPLLDTLQGSCDYDSVHDRRARLAAVFEQQDRGFSGRWVAVRTQALASDLRRKAAALETRARTQELVQSASGDAWFNGYYDNHGRPVEGETARGVRMTLTGQVFAIMSGVATDDHVPRIAAAVRRHLRDDRSGGYRLNSDFGEQKPDLGRAFAFAYGHKENGAVFSHMVVMYANALYRRGLAREGWDVLSSLYRLATDFGRSRVYPGLPEYFNARSRGTYHYLTGAASWLLLTMLTQVYGVAGDLGDLTLTPMLLSHQYSDRGEASVHARLGELRLHVVYHNTNRLDFDAVRIASVRIDGADVPFQRLEDGDETACKRGSLCTQQRGARVPRALLEGASTIGERRIDVALGPLGEVQ